MLKKSLELPKTEELINMTGKDSDCSFHDFVSYLQFEQCRLIQTWSEGLNKIYRALLQNWWNTVLSPSFKSSNLNM